MINNLTPFASPNQPRLVAFSSVFEVAVVINIDLSRGNVYELNERRFFLVVFILLLFFFLLLFCLSFNRMFCACVCVCACVIMLCSGFVMTVQRYPSSAWITGQTATIMYALGALLEGEAL